MPQTSVDLLLLDTSAAIALCVAGHEQHEATWQALAGRELGLAGHAVFETFSVLTRLPGGSRLTPTAAARVVSTNFPHSRFLSPKRAAVLLADLAGQGVAGGSVYDGLVAAAAMEHDATLVSRDLRAASIYRRLGARLQLLV